MHKLLSIANRFLFGSIVDAGPSIAPSSAVYPEIYPSLEQRAALQAEIGDLRDPAIRRTLLSYNVIVLSGGRCVKYGHQVLEREAISMEYVRRNTNIPVPRVHHFFKSEDGKGFLVMDYIENGVLLADVEYKLTSSQREQIFRQIHDYMGQMRRLGGNTTKSMGSWQPANPSQPTAYDNVFYRELEDLQPTAPFTSMEELKDHWRLRWLKRVNKLGPPPIVDVVELPNTVVLSHGDFGTHNILVHNGEITAVLDWDSFGWYPSFWEYAFCRRGSQLHPSWREVLDKVFGEMPIPELNFFKFINTAFSATADEI